MIEKQTHDNTTGNRQQEWLDDDHAASGRGHWQLRHLEHCCIERGAQTMAENTSAHSPYVSMHKRYTGAFPTSNPT
jgi:hypothetical protein